MHERHLLEILDAKRIQGSDTLWDFVDDSLQEPFNTRDLASAMTQPVEVARQFAYCLRNAGALEVVGKEGNALLYKTAR